MDKRDTMLEIGPGARPVYKRSEKIQEMIDSGALYLVTDTDNARFLLERVDRGAVVLPVQGAQMFESLRNVKTESVNKGVWIWNVFGAPFTAQAHFIDGRELTEEELMRFKKAMAQYTVGKNETEYSVLKGKELLAPGSSAYVVEFITPNIAS